VPAEDGNGDLAKIAELTALVQAVRERVRSRYPEPRNSDAASDHATAIWAADLMPLVHARDAAQAKIAAIGSVNPRAGGLVNNVIQSVKKTIARSLQWFVRDQISFNQEAVSAMEAVLEALNEHNRMLVSLAEDTALVKDMRAHWEQLRVEWEQKVAANEIQFLRRIAELQGAFQHRTMLIENNFRDLVADRHREFEGALDRTGLDIQKRLWADLEKTRADYERLIHTELHLIRQRAMSAAATATPAVVPAAPSNSTSEPNFDYARFAERFRGGEEYVRGNIAFYRDFFTGRDNVLDIGCGRGEFLELMRDLSVPAKGIDLSEESVAVCRQKGLDAETASLFPFLAGQPEGSFDGIFSSQVVEHLDPRQLPETISLCASRLRRGGVLAIETPNPECLAIFATHFYLDPTHTRPVPHPLLSFYMQESGLGQIEVHTLSPAIESFPELASLPEDFRKKFFGGLDYAIIGRKL
jgi:2-polyprenyl-3-methyl-5-hydroxy-6-metoxy-1,4-benzoquinol methylase